MTPTLLQIRSAVAAHYEITEADLTGPSRQAVFARPRMLAYKLSRDLTGASVSDIGRFYRKDHTSIISGIQSISNRAAHQAKLGQMDLRRDTDAITSAVTKLAIAENGGVFSSVRAKAAIFTTHQPQGDRQ